MIKKISWLCVMLGAAMPIIYGQENMIIQSGNKTSKLHYALIGDGDEQLLKKIYPIVRFDLEFSDQILVNRDEYAKSISQISPETLTYLFKHNIAGCVFLKIDDTTDKKNIQLTLYDTCSQEKLLEKQIVLSSSIASSAHHISHDLLLAITGESVALSKLAYCEQPSSNNKVIYVADYACRESRKVVDDATINVIPKWHPTKSGLFYSQFTDTNTRLMVYDFKGKEHKVVSSFPGLNMQPSFSCDGKQIVLCLSTKGNSELYLFDEEACKQKKNRYYTQLTYNKGNNTSPCLRKNGDIIFCSDFEGGCPQIYYRSSRSKKISRLTRGGYCVGLTYCKKIGTIAFARPVNGVFQLFSMEVDQEGKASCLKQLTHGGANKRAPAWSSCGKYLVFVYNHGDKNGQSTDQIATLNISSGSTRILTDGPNHKSFPAWC